MIVENVIYDGIDNYDTESTLSQHILKSLLID